MTLKRQGTTTHTDKNNLIGIGKVASLEALTEQFSKFDFGIKWTGSDGGVTGFGIAVALKHDFVYTSSSINAIWFADQASGTNIVFSVEWVAGTTGGTIKENYYNASGTLIGSRDNIDPGYGTTDTPGSGRAGPRYTFLLSSTEYRAYVNYKLGDAPVVVAAAPSTGFPFPLTLVASNPSANMRVRDITAAGTLRPSTIYSHREQIEDFAADQATIYLRIFQNGKPPLPDGFFVDVEFQTIGGFILLETADKLLTEASDKLLKE